MNKAIKQAVSGLIVQQQRILLIKREKQPYYNKWTLPGGKVEPGESLDAAIKREIREEVGYEVKVLPLYHVFLVHNYELTTKVCEVISQKNPQETIFQQWFEVQDFCKINPDDCTPSLQAICKKLLDDYEKL